MRSWNRLFSLKDKFRNYLFSKNSNTTNSTRSRARLFVASSSLLCTSAYFYYVNKNHNNTSSVLAAKTLDCLNDNDTDDLKLYFKRKECNRLIRRYKEEFGIPGVIVGVSQNGRTIYSKAFGYSDVENNVKAHAHTVVRIASISKPITCTLAARLFQDGKLDLDKPVNFYLNDLPPLKWNNRDVTITARQLMSHTSGIRHYEKFKDNKSASKSASLKSDETHNENIDDVGNDKSYKKLYPIQPAAETSGDSLFSEFFLNKPFKYTRDALELFIHDELMFEPGKGYLYSTYAFTLLSAVLEQCNGKDSKFADMLTNLFKQLEMNETYLDYNTPIIANRSKYYLRNEKKALVNVPHVDNSYKWAGGGILSTVGDLLKYANHLLRSYQNKEDTYLTSSTIKSYVWSPQSQPPKDDSPYGLGWHLKYDKEKKLKYVYHTGGAVGATTCLLIVPNDDKNDCDVNGLVVAVLCNSQDTRDIVKFSLRISEIFLQD